MRKMVGVDADSVTQGWLGVALGLFAVCGRILSVLRGLLCGGVAGWVFSYKVFLGVCCHGARERIDLARAQQDPKGP